MRCKAISATFLNPIALSCFLFEFIPKPATIVANTKTTLYTRVISTTAFTKYDTFFTTTASTTTIFTFFIISNFTISNFFISPLNISSSLFSRTRTTITSSIIKLTSTTTPVFLTISNYSTSSSFKPTSFAFIILLQKKQ